MCFVNICILRTGQCNFFFGSIHIFFSFLYYLRLQFFQIHFFSHRFFFIYLSFFSLVFVIKMYRIYFTHTSFGNFCITHLFFHVFFFSHINLRLFKVMTNLKSVNKTIWMRAAQVLRVYQSSCRLLPPTMTLRIFLGAQKVSWMMRCINIFVAFSHYFFFFL